MVFVKIKTCEHDFLCIFTATSRANFDFQTTSLSIMWQMCSNMSLVELKYYYNSTATNE